MRKVIYLASPYSHPSREVRCSRYQQAIDAVDVLMREGHSVYSPIAYGHQLAERGHPGDWEFWAALDERILLACDEVVVRCLDGWKESKGVAREIEIATSAGIPVRYS